MFDAFPETHDLWDVQQYANCLKKLNRLDEAEQVCEDVYSEFKDTEIVKPQSQAFLYIENLYAWIINDKYVKTIKQPDYKYSEMIFGKLTRLYDLLKDTKATKPSFPYCALTVLKQLNKQKGKIMAAEGLEILSLISLSELSSEAKSYTDSYGKTREFASLKEDYYTLKSDFLLDAKRYEDCIICCNEAMETLESFHYDNDIWFSRKISKSLGKLGKIDDAISKLEKLTIISDKWFLLYEIGKYYLQLNNLDEALTYMLRAVCTKDPEWMKVSLIESIGDLLTENRIMTGRLHIVSKEKLQNKKKLRNDPSKWVIFEGTQEAIVDKQKYEIVQKIREGRRKPTAMGEMNVFSGMVYCADCGKKMYLCRSSAMKQKEYFNCSSYRKQKKSNCSSHQITVEAIEEIVLSYLKRVSDFVIDHEKEFIDIAIEHSRMLSKK